MKEIYLAPVTVGKNSKNVVAKFNILCKLSKMN